ncbi:dual specificity tyrosine-phosphorylation-regulated kinase 1 [Fistulifera solaris]|uniref:Dual specificity tyrosine-phosphorylation-regulated kinase 1 n=1 Tax=Fistulifera solaris TaxID=1519565 RepID=A0A1Z5KH26_FISSO|nr:dual specificity tyrosine-phosphorylation-regulated kinase 1 [Fistulifera solaris]|eukprot:GAX25415.1 dual specificity tyrosine-phosphorylation-regulated kinase 1 [Fistulifera solaris]
MDHSEDKDKKLPAVPQQHQHPSAQARTSRQQQWPQAEFNQQAAYIPHQNPYQQALPSQNNVMAQDVMNIPPYPQQSQPQSIYQTGVYPHFNAQQPYPPPPMYYQQQPPPAGPPLQQIAYPPHPFIQPNIGRLPSDRPLVKLSVSLIDTYKRINTVYYEERDARRAARSKEKGKSQGTYNNGWDDEHYDYIVTPGEMFHGRYKIKERIGKGSFGQVVRAEDIETKQEVAIKIIKSKKPFLMQAKTEIELLTHLSEKDSDDEHNIVRLLTHFMYRNHQCLVFEMLSLNLYELLKNTQFGGVSLNLIRKFAKQVLKALSFLARKDVDVIHCDLKPENILLRHPKKSGVKVIDFGSSCRSNKRMYSYIQSRFYRSPEVMLGLPYSVAIDMWSLGCILVEMHTGEPLFSGSDQFDQMQKIVKTLGMVPSAMLNRANDQNRQQFFDLENSPSGKSIWKLRQTKRSTTKESTSASSQQKEDDPPKALIVPSLDPVASLSEVVQSGPRQKKKFPPVETLNSPQNYALFVDLVHKMLAYEPSERITPLEALNHPFIAEQAMVPLSVAQVPAGD